MTNTYLPKTLFLLLACFFLGNLQNGQAQIVVPNDTSAKSEQLPKALLLHYTPSELADIQSSDSLKYQTLVYYYGQSFLLETVSCSDCVPLDLSYFDVSKYEKLRKQSTRYTRVFDKHGFKLTLLSVDELVYKLPIHLNP